jgi:hypothetical protein
MTGSKAPRFRSFARKKRLLRMTGCLVSRAAQNPALLLRSAQAWLEQKRQRGGVLQSGDIIAEWTTNKLQEY